MKFRFLLWMMLFSQGVWAQITLTIEDAPMVGDTIIYVTDTLVADLSVGASGPDQSWDFSQLGVSTVEETRYIAPEDAPNNESFPGANLVQELEDIYNFVEVNDSGIFALGSTLDFFGGGDLLIIPFDPPQTFFEFPATFGDSYTDTTAFNIQIEDPIFGSDSVRVNQVTIQEVAIDAYGTLTTPGGTFETLRREIVTNTMFTVEALLFGNWVVVQNTNETITSYEWIAAEGKTQVLTIDLDAMGVPEEASYQVEEVPGMAPEADFLVTTNDGSTMNFSDESLNDPTSWMWDFGDGNTSTAQNPEHAYVTAGFYTVCLIASNFFGSDTTCQQVEVIFPPTAGFSYVEETVGKFIFTDESLNNPETWFWDFGDGFTSMEQNPTHSYLMVGTLTVCLTVGNPVGSDQYCEDVEVVLSPEASFNFIEVDGGTFEFIDLSSNNPTSWEWDFGDGGTSMEQNPVYSYMENGVYTVCLKAANSAGSNTSCKEVEAVVTSTDPLSVNRSMVVQPNPAVTRVEVNLSGYRLAGKKVRVLNLLGQQMFQAEAQNTLEIDIASWGKGIYVYLLEDEDGSMLERGKLQVK